MAYPETLRDRLPRSEAYPLSRTSLDASMAAAGVEAVSLVYFLRAGIDEWRALGCGRVLSVEFTPARADRQERLEVRVHAVPKDQKHLVAEAFTLELLRQVAVWIRAAETSENVWRGQDHGLVVRWDGDELSANEF